MKSISRSLARDLAIQFSWPFRVAIAVGKAADHEFKPSVALRRAIIRGDQSYQNVQFALYAKVSSAHKQLALDLIVSRFRSPVVRASSTSNHLRTFDLGEAIGVLGERYTVPDEQGRDVCTGVKLQKRHGTNLTTTLVLYDKAGKLGLTPAEALEQGLADLLRLDITMRQACMQRLFTEARRLAEQSGEVIQLSYSSAGKVRCTAANLIWAIQIVDKYFVNAIEGRNYFGFEGWLASRVTLEWFYLHELLSFSPEKWREVEHWMADWSLRDQRYKEAFVAWRAADHGKNTNLGRRLKAAGFSDDTAEDRLRELRALGFSGAIPPRYWVNLADRALIEGATYKESRELQRRVREKRNVTDLISKRQRRMRQAHDELQRAFAGLSRLSPTSAAPIIGAVTPPVALVRK